MSPGLMLRPSLSVDADGQAGHDRLVSPGLMLRPSLSALRQRPDKRETLRVAGADAPAFVER